MRAGSLDRRLTLQRPTTSKDKLGAKAETFAPVATVWASHRPIRDDERIRAQAVEATVSDRFQIRWSSALAALDPSWRLEFEGRSYGVVGVKPLGRRDGIEITANAIAAGGVR